MRRVPFGNATVFVHASGDFVSDSILRYHTWESAETQEMLWWVVESVSNSGVRVLGCTFSSTTDN